MDVIMVGPKLYGRPCQRRRKYMILLKKDILKLLPAVIADSIEQTFNRMFQRGTTLKGEDCMRAPKKMVDKILSAKSVKRGLPETMRYGRT